MKVSRYTVLHPGDILLINFGKSTSRSRVDGRRLAYVIGREDISSRDHHVMVIPVFRQPSKHSEADDILIKKNDCKGLRYTQYANPSNVQKIDRYRVERLIGHVQNQNIRDEITRALIREAGDIDDK